MKFADILARLTGGRFCCSAQCCGAGYCKPCEKDELSFDTLLLTRLIIASLMFAAALVVKKLPEPWPLLLLILSALTSGLDILIAAVLSLMRRSWFDKTVVITFVCALAFGLGHWAEAAALVLIFQLCDVFIDYAFVRTRLSVLEAVDCRREGVVIVINEQGVEEPLSADEVPVGARIALRPGETVPCDCIVLDGAGSLSAAPLGGGAEPQFISEGDELLSGCELMTGNLLCEVTGTAAESAASALRDAVLRGASRGSPLPHKLERIYAFFTPAMFLLSIFIAGLIPIIYKVSIQESVQRALSFLILSNPCALLVAAPLIRLASIAGGAIRGILPASCDVMDALSRAGAVAFDRPGTLSDGTPRVTAVKSARLDADTLLKITAHAMAYSSDKLARSVINAYGGTIYIELVEKFVEYPGSGVEVYVDGVRICAGSYDLMQAKGVEVPVSDITDELAIYVSVAEDYAGRLSLTDGLRKDAPEGISELHSQHVDAVVMFTDESSASAAKTAAELGVKEYYSGKTAAQQLSALSDIKDTLPAGDTLLYVRGIDHIGAERSGAGVDVVMTGSELPMTTGKADLRLRGGVMSVAAAIHAARTSERLIYIFAAAALLVKLLVMVLAFFGIGAAWFAVFIDSAVSMGAILLSIKAMNSGILH